MSPFTAAHARPSGPARLAVTGLQLRGQRQWALGRSLAGRRQWRQAAQAFERAARACPQDALFWLNLAHAHSKCGAHEDSEAAARRCLALDPSQPVALRLLGEALVQQHRYADADEAFARLDALGQADAGGLVRQAGARQALRQHGPACELLLRALSMDPTHTPAYGLLAESLRERGLKREAVECLKTVLALQPGRLETWIRLSYEKRHLMDWTDLDADQARIAQLIAALDAGSTQVLATFALLSLPLDPALCLQAARAESRALASASMAVPLPALDPARRPPGRIRVGWLSFDFRMHAVSQLLVEVLERLDRGRFEVFLYSTGPDDGSPLRTRLMAAADRFVELRGLSDEQAAHRIRADGMDLMVDLAGHTKGQRMGILARKPAPVQLGLLGYPHTTGADFIDYIVGDPFVTPLALAGHYSECIAQMPLTFQPNDRMRPVPQPMTRAEAGLPQDAYVICAFNHTYKILPAAFSRWCAVLRRVPQAVLWLKQTNGQLHDNVRREALAQGVDPARILFAPNVAYDQHFSRLALADVFADTWPYNAHTTASDALWAGVPVVTRYGNSYASRVAASVLNAAGLGELAFDNDDDYENALVAIGMEPRLLAAYRTHLLSGRDHLPLWDTPRYAVELGDLLQRMFQRWVAGQAPQHLPAAACDVVHATPAV